MTRPALVEVWSASLECGDEEAERYRALLSPDERQRAARLRRSSDRRDFTVARGVLRSLLGRYLDVAPHAVELAYASHGKPCLAGAAARSSLQFNLSHSGGLALVALAWGRVVGVDVEQVRPLPDALRIAETFFSAEENRALRALPEAVREEAFFTCWTRKEAYIKAIGEGLSLPLHDFDVALAPGEPARLLATRGAMSAAWTMEALALPPGYVGAVVAAGRGWEIARHQWTHQLDAHRHFGAHGTAHSRPVEDVSQWSARPQGDLPDHPLRHVRAPRPQRGGEIEPHADARHPAGAGLRVGAAG